MKLPIIEAVRTAINFDNLVREGMTTTEQIGFLIDNYAQLDKDYRKIDEIRMVILSYGAYYHVFRPLTTFFDSSAFAWNIYRPENLVDLTIQQLATLARIHDTKSDIPVQYQTIIEATHILPRATRALFCAIQMRGDTSKCIIRHLRMAIRFQNTLAVFASEDSTISSVLRMHLNCLKH